MTKELGLNIESGKEGFLEEVHGGRALKTPRRESGHRSTDSEGRGDEANQGKGTAFGAGSMGVIRMRTKYDVTW